MLDHFRAAHYVEELLLFLNEVFDGHVQIRDRVFNLRLGIEMLLGEFDAFRGWVDAGNSSHANPCETFREDPRSAADIKHFQALKCFHRGLKRGSLICVELSVPDNYSLEEVDPNLVELVKLGLG